jgi:6-phosphofructokinase 2
MPSIVTITFSPCIDKSTTVRSLIPEKKLRCTTPILEPGGGGINVARALKKLGIPATAIFPSGGYTGKYFNHLLEQENVPSVIIETFQETRENIIVLDESTNHQYRFGMPGTALSQQEWMRCLDAAENIKDARFIVASGSLPPGVPNDIYARLARIAKSKNADFIVDTSGRALRAAMDEGVYLIKPNLGELSELAGTGRMDGAAVKEAAHSILASGKAQVLIVSMGSKGAMLVTKDITEIIAAPPVLKRSTVGAGDSMVAGIICYLSLGKSLQEAARYGVACGTAATMNTGTQLCSKEEADSIYRMIQKEANSFKAHS